MVPRKVQTGKHERGIGEEKNNSFMLGGVGKAPLWRQTGTWGIIECWWAKWPGEGMAFQAEETVWAKTWRQESHVCSGNSSWGWVAGKGRANGKMWRVWLYEYWKKYFWNTWLRVCGGIPMNVQLFLLWMPAIPGGCKVIPFSCRKI